MTTTARTSWAEGSLAADPGPAPTGRMLASQTRAELLLVLRNGEQVLLSLLIPLGLLLLLTLVHFVSVPDGVRRVDFFVPGVLALAIMSAAFTGQAIGTGFERQYGVLKRLGATPLPRSVLLLSKTLAVLSTELLQLLLLGGVGYALGWDPRGSVLTVLALVVLGTAAFSGLGLLLGGTLRGLTTLAVANLLWFVLLVFGGVLFDLSQFGGAAPVLRLLPTAALAHGLRASLVSAAPVGQDVLVLAVWAVAALVTASRAFRWE